MPSKYEHDKALYAEIINFVRGKPHNLKPDSTDLIKAEIAAWHILKFPELGTEDNEDALMLLLILDRKYEEYRAAILREEEEGSYLSFLAKQDLARAHAKLEALGLVPATDDLPF
jgi:hypothetical protein